MEIATLRKMLELGPYDELAFGAPDKTGWMNVEVTDVLSGDFRVVGQYKGGAFRPTGASQATHLRPLREGGRQTYNPHDYPSMTIDEAITFVGIVVSGWLLIYGVGGLILGHGRTSDGKMTLFASAVLVGCLLARWILFDRTPEHAGDAATVAQERPAIDLASSRFSMATRTCPGCGAPVGDVLCTHCGWERPREDYQ